jgi:hypothetical protein
MSRFISALASFLPVVLAAGTASAGHYENFNVVIYIASRSTQQLSEPKVLQHQEFRITAPCGSAGPV